MKSFLLVMLLAFPGFVFADSWGESADGSDESSEDSTDDAESAMYKKAYTDALEYLSTEGQDLSPLLAETFESIRESNPGFSGYSDYELAVQILQRQ